MIDFSNVKSITIPEGDVAMITRGSEILWRKQRYKQELLYLESTGTQYIDTAYASGKNIKYQIVASILETKASSEYKGFYGTSIAPDARCGSGFYNGKIRVQFGSGSAVYDSNYHDCNYTGYANPTTYELSKDGFYINGTLEWKPKATLNNSTNISIYLFNTHAESNYNGTLLKIYSFKLWDGDVLVRDFIPVLDWNDVPCMYDKVSNELFYNQGAGAFKYEELPRLPLEYQEVEYLEGTGTQYIDTGVTINTATDDVEYVFQCTEQNVYKWFFGEHDNNARFGLGSGDGSNKRNVAYGNTTYKVTDTQFYNSQHTFTANQSGVFIDGTKIANFASFKSSSTLYLFSLNLNGGNYAAAAKVWSYKHHRNGELIREFVPCVRKSDNKPGMYDFVTETFFANAGTGEFLYQ